MAGWQGSRSGNAFRQQIVYELSVMAVGSRQLKTQAHGVWIDLVAYTVEPAANAHTSKLPVPQDGSRTVSLSLRFKRYAARYAIEAGRTAEGDLGSSHDWVGKLCKVWYLGTGSGRIA